MLAKRKMNCSEAKKIEMVGFLISLGCKPTKINSKEAWYTSPLRPTEKTPSFRVNRARQLWYDYGTGEGGDIIKFGCMYYQCSIKELLERLSGKSFSFSQPIMNNTLSKPKVLINSINDIQSTCLLNYIRKRKIDIDLAKKYCKQINYRVGNYCFEAIGFKNDSGGWDLRKGKYKGATQKDLSTIGYNSSTACLFEGFFDTLSFIQLYKETTGNYDLITLNSVSLSKRFIEIASNYKNIFLFLDNDQAGQDLTSQLMGIDKELFINKSHVYKGYKDLNEFLISTNNNTNQKRN